MPIELGDARVSDPTIKTLDIGDEAVGHIVNTEKVAAYDFDSGERKLSKKGNPLDQQKITIMLVSTAGEGVAAGTRSEPVDPTPGEVFTIWSGVGGLFEWRDGVQAFLKKHGRQVSVGDVVRWRLDREDEPKKPGYNGQKHRSYTIRPPKDDEAAAVARCETLYRERSTPATTLTDEPVGDADNWDDPDEMPF